MAHNDNRPEKKNIIFLTDNYQSLGGVQRSTTTIANALYSRGHAVKIVSVSPGAIPMSHNLNPKIKVVTCNPKIPAQQKFAYSSLGRKVYRPLTKILHYWKPGKLQFAPPLKEGVKKLSQELETHTQDSIIVVTNVAAMNYLNNALEQRTSPRPKIIGQYKGDFSILPPANVERLVRTYASADLLLALTQEDADQLLKFATTRVNYITNPFPAAPPAYLDTPREKHFVALGRLAPEKSYASAIQAWKPIAKRFPNWKLTIFGEGPLQKKLEELIHKEGLEGSVTLPGRTEDPLLVLASARANIVTSKHEGLPLTIAEAATVGTPTIAFDSSPGIRVQVQDEENGLLVPAGNIAKLTTAMERLILDQKLYEKLSSKALLNVRKFGVEATMLQWEQFFDEVAS